MCVVNAIDFKKNPSKYFRIAQTERVVIEDEGQTYELIRKEPSITDEDRARGITGDELLARVLPKIEEMYKNRK